MYAETFHKRNHSVQLIACTPPFYKNRSINISENNIDITDRFEFSSKAIEKIQSKIDNVKCGLYI